MSLGTFIFNTFYKPTASIRYKFHHFGIKGWHAYNSGEAEMKKAAATLPEVTLNPTIDLATFNYLTGQKYWHQTIFGIQSLIDHYGTNLAIHIYSDGSLNARHAELFKNYCPQIVLVDEKRVLEILNHIIPGNKYPSLNFLRNWHPFFRRMFDIHCQMGWSIHLDSDMLFFKNPAALISSSQQKEAFFMQEQAGQSFFADDEHTLLKKFKIPTIQSVNGGIIAYDGSAIDYDAFEYKAKQLLDNYFNKGPAAIEQTLMSNILYLQKGVPLSQTDYKIYYDSKIDAQDNAVLRHYIFKAKLPYFSTEWRKVAH